MNAFREKLLVFMTDFIRVVVYIRHRTRCVSNRVNGFEIQLRVEMRISGLSGTKQRIAIIDM